MEPTHANQGQTHPGYQKMAPTEKLCQKKIRRFAKKTRYCELAKLCLPKFRLALLGTKWRWPPQSAVLLFASRGKWDLAGGTARARLGGRRYSPTPCVARLKARRPLQPDLCWGISAEQAAARWREGAGSIRGWREVLLRWARPERPATG